MEYIDKLPDELCCKPKPLIVFSGLDTERNQVHRSIWRAFNTSKSHDRDSFKFRCRSVDHQFPKPKYKQLASYEWLMPKGILKTGWMKKHLEEIPAFVALFYDLDWDEPQWGERSTECAQMVATVRSKLAGRESKLVVILIQKRAPLPLGEDLNAMDRAQSLCNKCDLPGKNLFVLSHTNLLYGCITRLEDEFRDMAANYYHNQAKKVKAHKDSLNKTSHQLLFVRHEFKIAFYAELKQDPGLALKHYQQAYNHLTELRMLDAHLLEVKTVAGFINYKICRLSFQNNASDAISQFRRHINFFANLVGLPQLAFEHEAWMSKQFEILGDLFQEAIKSSLTPLITQHPGLYYQEASRHAVCRRQLCQALCIPTVKAAEMNADDRLYYPLPTESNEPTVGIDAAFATDSGLFAEESESSPHLPNHSLECSRSKRTAINTAVEFVRAQSPLLFKKQTFTADSPNLSGYHSPSQVPAADCLSATEKINGLEFYGQRPWRQGIQSIEPPNPTKEREGILSLQKEELKVDHSVECPSSSLNTPPSTINKPLIGNFSTHQTSQTWSSKFILDSKEKFKVILLCLNPDVLGNQIKVDSIHLCLSPPMVNCHEDIINELILCTVSWQWNTKSDYHPYVSGRKTIGHKHHNLKKQHDVLHDNVNTISNNNCGLWCKEVVLSVPERRMQKNPIKIESNGFIINHGFPNLPPDWDIIDSRIRTEMHHPSSGLEITMPENVCILANEISQIKLTIRNPTLSDCTKLNLTVRLIPREKDSTEFPDNASNTSTTVSTTTMITNPTVIDNYIIVGSSSELISHISAKNINSSQKPSSAYFTKKLDDIPSNQSISVTISLCCSSPSLVSNNNQTLSCYLTFSTKILPCEYPDYLLSLSDSLTTETTLVYNVINESVKLSNNMELSNINNHLVQNIMDQNAMVIQCTQNIETNITILSPFELDYKLLSLTQHPIKSLIVNDEFLLLFKLTNTADCELEIHDIQLEVANEISCGSDSHNTCIKNLIMQSSESCTECHMLLLTETMNSLETINLGSITVHWSRVSTRDHDDMKPYIATTKFTLPTIPVLSLPIQISAELPAYGVMLTPFPITFILSNKTIYPQEAVFQLESIHGFMFSGQQKLKLRLLPDSPHYLNYTLLPLMSGNLKLPR
ncbi:unnamed protein product [Schistosoma bovis]|nr:unnamed protein product [Schistosoma bovis]